MSAGIGVMELLVLFFMGGSTLLGLPLGLPPGETDEALMRAPPAGCVFYSEWAGRSAGEAGAPGVDGFAADPEIVSLIENVDRAIRTAAKEGGEGLPARLAAYETGRSLIQRPGCLFVSFRSDDLGERGAEPNPGLIVERLQIAIVVQAGDSVEELEASLRALLSAIGASPAEGMQRIALPLPLPGGGPVLHREGSRFLLCYGTGTLDAVLAGLSSGPETRPVDSRRSDAFRELGMERTAQRVWIDLQRIAAIADIAGGERAMIRESIAMLGLEGLDSAAGVIGVEPKTGRIASTWRLQTDGARKGLLSLLAARPLREEDFSHIPADADLVVGTSVDLEAVLDAAQRIAAESDAELGVRFDAAVQELETAIGVSLRKELFPAFGSAITLYDSPSNGGVMLTAPVLALEVRDPQKAYAVFTQLMQSLDQSLPHPNEGGRTQRGVTLGQEKFLDRTIYFVNVIGDDFPFAPSFCVTNTHLLFSLTPQPIKGHLRYMAAESPRWSSALGKDSPLRTHQLNYFARIDAEAASRYAAALLPYFGQIVASELQREGVPIDVFAVPSARAILPYAGESTMWIEVTEHGVLFQGVDGFPIPGGSSMLISTILSLGRGSAILR